MKPESELNPCWFHPTTLKSEGGVEAETSPKESSHVQNNFRTTAAQQQFKKSHHFIHIFKSAKPDAALSYYKYKNYVHNMSTLFPSNSHGDNTNPGQQQSDL